MSAEASAWDRVRKRPDVVLYWALFVGVIAWSAWRSFPTAFDPSGEGSGARGSDFVYYYHGAEGVWNGTDPYARFDFGFREGHAYNYPPMLATGLAPLTPLGMVGAAQVWFTINVALVAGVFLASYRIIAGRFRLRTDALSWGAVLALSVLASIEVVRREIDDLQTDTLMLASLLAMLVCMDRRADLGRLRGVLVWPLLAGLALAVGIHVKFLLLVFLPYLLITARLRVLAWTLGWVIALFLGTALVSGWDDNLRHYAIATGGAVKLLGIDTGGLDLSSRVHDLTWHNSVSIPSAFARALAGEATVGLGDTGPEYSRGAVMALSACAALACLAVAWLIYRVHGVGLFAQFWSPTRRLDTATRARFAVLEVTMMVVALQAFSPQTMKRHMFLAVPLFVLAAGLSLMRRRGVPVWTAPLALALIAGGMMLPPGSDATRELVRDWKWISGVSWTLLIGAFLTMWTALRTSRVIDAGEPLLGAGPQPAPRPDDT